MDWVTRKVLSYRLSNTPDASFCIGALKEVIAGYGEPEIMGRSSQDLIGNHPNRCQFNNSMDGRGPYLDNISIQRLWRSLKQQAVYQHELQDGFQTRHAIENWMAFYCTKRPHTGLNKRTPDTAYFGSRKTKKAA